MNKEFKIINRKEEIRGRFIKVTRKELENGYYIEKEYLFLPKRIRKIYTKRVKYVKKEEGRGYNKIVIPRTNAEQLKRLCFESLVKQISVITVIFVFVILCVIEFL